MRWVLLWVVLVLGAAAVLGLIGRNLWRKAKALTGEMSAASERLSAVASSLADLQERAGGADDDWARPKPPASRRGRRRRT
jgi:hypothetical protein